LIQGRLLKGGGDFLFWLMGSIRLTGLIGFIVLGIAGCQKPKEQKLLEKADKKVGLPAQVDYAQKQLGLTSTVVNEQQLDFYSTSGGTNEGKNPPVAPGGKSPISGAGGEPSLSSYQPNQFRPSS
jgi:hypothetical protein